MGFLNFFKRGKSAIAPKRDEGIGEEHVQLRRAIERCDGLKFAVDAGQLSIADVVEKLLQNDFPKAVARKAIAECFGEAAAERYVK